LGKEMFAPCRFLRLALSLRFPLRFGPAARDLRFEPSTIFQDPGVMSELTAAVLCFAGDYDL
jgi:hypothetical protein